jgi:glyoxylase-like metal-dependent hydrolase (beta-lactamase superfamily II)
MSKARESVSFCGKTRPKPTADGRSAGVRELGSGAGVVIRRSVASGCWRTGVRRLPAANVAGPYTFAMNLLEQQLDYPLAERLPEPGHTLEIAPGVRWLRMALPFALDHINLWMLRDEIDGRDGWTLVDCGIANDATRAAWERVFAEEMDGLPVLRVIATHMHPDHLGLAHWLTERWQVRLWISATDYASAQLASRSTTGFGGDRAAAFMASHGLTDPQAQEKIRARSNYYASMVPEVPAAYRRLMDGGVLHIGPAGPDVNTQQEWTCHAGYGHAPEHMALHSETLGLLISGDMVLPRISTNVSVVDFEPEANPLALFLASIQRLRGLPADTLVLPSHGRPFRGLHTRIDQLTTHHDERFADVLAACAKQPQTAAELLPVLFKRPLDLHQTTFAMGESIAHLNALWHAGKLVRRVGDDGVHRFAA